MATLDIKKFKKILQNYEISIIDYYLMDGKCSMIKAFINSICEFLIIYIPSKLRFEIDSQNAYEVVEIEDDSENDDYSNSSKIPNIQKIDEEKNESKYEELTKKYKINISLDESDEPISRKLKRQVNRLKMPFSSLDYDIGINSGKYMGISFGDSVSIFQIKNYRSTNKNIMYLINVNNLVKKINEINDNISNIKNQFYDILQNVSISNFESMSSIPSYSSFNNNYESFFNKIMIKGDEYKKSIQDYNNIYKKIKEKEENIIEEYNKTSSIEDPLKRKTLTNKYQKELNDVFYSKTDIIKKGILLASKYQKSLVTLEEVSFDNSIMIDRVYKNFEQLKELL
jgi:hypothetical protein